MCLREEDMVIAIYHSFPRIITDNDPEVCPAQESTTSTYGWSDRIWHPP